MFSKKGSSHLEMILAFILFIGFISFLFFNLKPYDTAILPVSLANGVHYSLEKMIKTNLTVTSVKLTGVNLNFKCFKVDIPGKYFKYDFSKQLVKDESGIKVASGVSSSGNNREIFIEGMENYYKIYFSPELNEFVYLETTCLDPQSSIIGSITEKEISSYKKLMELNAKYSSDYESLKSELGIPAIFDFEIISLDNPEINMETDVPNSIDVIAVEKVFEILNGDGEIINSRIVVRIW